VKRFFTLAMVSSLVVVSRPETHTRILRTTEFRIETRTRPVTDMVVQQVTEQVSCTIDDVIEEPISGCIPYA